MIPGPGSRGRVSAVFAVVRQGVFGERGFQAEPHLGTCLSPHRPLGSGPEDWNGMGTAWSYSGDPNDEHDAVRERSGMFDMPPLKKVHVRGSDARAVLNHATTRDMDRVQPGQAAVR